MVFIEGQGHKLTWQFAGVPNSHDLSKPNRASSFLASSSVALIFLRLSVGVESSGLNCEETLNQPHLIFSS